MLRIGLNDNKEETVRKITKIEKEKISLFENIISLFITKKINTRKYIPILTRILPNGLEIERRSKPRIVYNNE